MDPVMGQPAMYNPYGSMPALPAGWVEHRTPTGQPYWFNSMTGQSSWVYPIMPVIPPKKKKQIKKKIPGTHWLFVLTHDGYEFYYDRDTKTSIWEMPQELKEPMEELKKLEEEQEEEAKRLKEEEVKAEQDKKRTLEEEEQQLEAKRVKLEQEIVDNQETEAKEQELDATEMTEEDIMWQLQQMQGSDEEEEEEQEQQQEVVKEIVKQEEPVVEKKTEMTEEERIDKFNELLLERNISPFAMYATEYPDLMTDPRFSLVPPNKQKSLFNKYCHALGEKIKDEKKKKNNRKPEDEFKELLVTKVTKKMYWDDFRRKFKDDPRFKALHVTKEKEALFKEHVKYNLNKQRDQVEEYINLLRETKEIKSGIRWRDAKQWLEHDERYLLLDKDKREDVFRDYLDDI